MGVIALFLILFLSMVLTSYILKLKMEDAIPISNFIIIIIIYISGIIFLNLKIGIGIILILILSGLIIFYKNGQIKEKNNFSRNGMIYFCLIFIFSIMFPYKREFVSWDEFSHWGLVVKNMFALNYFGNLENTTTLFKGYPPAMSIFQYFFMKIFGEYKENLSYSAMIFFNLSLLSPLFKNIKSLITTLILTFFTIIFMTFVSLEIYTTIYIDLSLGVLAAYILFNSLDIVLSRKKLVSMGLGIFILPLMKSSGTFIAILITIIITCNIIKEKLTKREKVLKGSILPLFLIISKYSWDIYTRVTSNFIGAWGGMKNFTITKFFKFWLNGVGLKYQFETKSNFINALSEERFSVYILKENKLISFFSFSLVILMISLIIYILSKDKQKIKVALIGINLIGAIYAFSLLNLYVYTFSEYEAVKLASFSRYLKTYFIFAIISLYCIIISELKINIKNSYLSLLLIMALPFLTQQYEDIKLNFLKPIERIKLNENLKKLINKNDKLYFIAQNTKGYQYWVARYEYTPGKMLGSWNWSIGEKYFDNDIWTTNITIDKFEENIKNSNYVYLYKIDEKFKEKYGEVFKENLKNISSGDIFKIDLKNDKIEFMNIEKIGEK